MLTIPKEYVSHRVLKSHTFSLSESGPSINSLNHFIEFDPKCRSPYFVSRALMQSAGAKVAEREFTPE